MESYSYLSSDRSIRGGSDFDSGTDGYASTRGFSSLSSAAAGLGFRPALYIK